MANNFFEDMVRVKRERESRVVKIHPNSIKMEEVRVGRPQVPKEIEISEVNEQVKENAKETARENERESIRENRGEDGVKQVKVKGQKAKYTLWVVAIAAVLFLVFALSFLFSKAVVTVNAKVSDINLNQNFSATKDSNMEDISYNLVEITGEETKTLKTNGQKEVSQRATGTVVIFNSFSSASQPLSIDTRLLGTNGKIYKTLTRTTVPGTSGSGMPGSVEVEIYAVEPGAQYNSPPMDFTIVGFKGTSKFKKIYARSKGEIKGGLIGNFPALSEEEKSAALSEMKITLEAKLLKKATDQTPPGFILFKDAVFLNTEVSNSEVTFSGEDSAQVKLKGTLYGFLFDEAKLSNKIAEDTIAKFDGSPVMIPNISALLFSLPAQPGIISGDVVSFREVEKISFNLKGPIKIAFKVDEDKLRADLLGVPKKSFNQVLLKYPNIDRANLVISPFWKMSVPDKIKDIDVKVNYPE